MNRSRRAPVYACAIVFIIAVAQPGVLWAQNDNKRPAPANAQVSGKAAERDNAQPSEHGKGHAVEHAKGQPTEHAVVRPPDGNHGHAVARVDERWWDRDRNYVVVHEYYGRHGLPPGLAKKHKLPPGLRKQLKERGHLPPGLERYWVVLPVEMERTLPPLPPHYVRRVVDDDLLVIDVRTNFVVSIMAGVFIRG
jgi:hypothetical protein